MPTYHYRCSACQHAFDQVQRFGDAPLVDCPECGGSIRRVPQPVGIVFKGSGWYVNDSRKSNGKESTDGRSTNGKVSSDDAAKSTKAEAGDTPKSTPTSKNTESKPASVGSDG